MLRLLRPLFPNVRFCMNSPISGPDSLSRGLWLILIAIHLHRPTQMRERELNHLPLAIFFDIHLSHHKRIGDFVPTDYCQKIDIV